MTTNDDRSILVLNELLVTARDAERGFQMASDHIKQPELVELFADLTLQRAKFARELEERIRTMRSEPTRRMDLAAALHRAWMGIKEAVESNETHAVLAECERGEDMALKVYASALKDPDVDKQSLEIIQRQYELVQAAHDRVKQLRDSATYAHR